MSKLRTLFHPIFIFIGIQVAWIILMGVWIYWYLKNSRDLEEFARRFQPGLFSSDFNWIILLEGAFLMLIILAGVYMIFVYWNKQARLNRLQSNFVSSVSHELKSPLASIQLYLETLKYHKVSEKETHDFVEIMLTDTERLSSLIENILEASKYDPKRFQFQFEPVDIESFVREVLATYSRQLEEKECEVRLEVEDSPVLNIDKRSIRMVLGNLIGNALRYSPSKTVISVRIKTQGKFCVIEIIDQGIGLEKKERKKVFKKFYRVNNHRTQDIEGAGLGLFIASEIVKNHKGKIKATSSGVEKGSEFTVSLPLKFIY